MRTLHSHCAPPTGRHVKFREPVLNLILVRLACCCGLRVSEIANLQIADVRCELSRPQPPCSGLCVTGMKRKPVENRRIDESGAEIVSRVIVSAALILFVFGADDTPQTVFDFTGADAAKERQNANDAVMGGLSEGNSALTDFGVTDMSPPPSLFLQDTHQIALVGTDGS